VRRLILGIGNTIMGDDGVGIHIVRMVKERTPPGAELQFKELGASGIKLVEEMLGYDEVIVVDSYASTDAGTGRIREFRPEDFEDTLHASSPHGANFATALEFYRKLHPDKIPRRIRILTVDIHAVDTFRDGLSNHVQDAATKLVEMIIRELGQTGRFTERAR